jgi:hypothetical protein
MATDGLWEFISDQEAVDIVTKAAEPSAAVNELIKEVTHPPTHSLTLGTLSIDLPCWLLALVNIYFPRSFPLIYPWLKLQLVHHFSTLFNFIETGNYALVT